MWHVCSLLKQEGGTWEKEWNTCSTATRQNWLSTNSRSQTERPIKGEKKWNRRSTGSAAYALMVAIHSEGGVWRGKTRVHPRIVTECHWAMVAGTHYFLGPYWGEGMLSARKDIESLTWGRSFAILLFNHSSDDQLAPVTPTPLIGTDIILICTPTKWWSMEVVWTMEIRVALVASERGKRRNTKIPLKVLKMFSVTLVQ